MNKLKKFREHFDMFQKKKIKSIEHLEKIFNEKYQQKGGLIWTVYRHSL